MAGALLFGSGGRETIPRGTVPRVTVPGETAPHDTIPSVTTPRDTIPGETAPRDTVPSVTTPRDTIPGETAPRDTVPSVTTPRDTIPGDTIPGDIISRETAPRDTVPSGTIPRDNKPRGTIPRDTVPRNTIPGDTIPRDTIPRDTIPAVSAPPPPVPEWMTTAREHTSLGIRVRGRSEMGGVWDRFSPCAGLASQRCDASAAPRLDPDVRLGLQVGGTLMDRVHVNVDYDGAREFDSSNDIRVRYDGRAGELIRRIDAGNVGVSLPASRYLGGAVPVQSWGVRALAQTGAVEWQALWAQGGGEVITREFRLGEGGTALQQVTSSWDDADYAAGQFFFLFDPSRIGGYPHLDVLALSAADGPPEWVPAAGVRLFRFEGGTAQRDGSTTTLRAVAEPGDPLAPVAGAFRLLQEGEDYQLHRSGLWIGLRQPLRDDEALAVAYRTLSGAEVGDAAAGGPSAEAAEVRLLRPPRLAGDPSSGTWGLEMRHLYRVSGSDEIAAADLELVISRGEAYSGDLGRTVAGRGVVPYLRLLGLDNETPHDRLDAHRIFRPGQETLRPVVGGTYVVFPTLRPFAEPAAVPVLGLSAAEVAEILGEARNPDLYQVVDRRDQAAAARFRLRFEYRSRSQQSATGISLGTLGIRDGSERVTAGGRLLQRGTDYEIDYELGRLELRGAASGAASDLRVSFEQIPLFAARPVQVAALAARVPLGDRGALSLAGVSQRERSLLRRPTLGLESDAVLLGAAEGSYRWPLPGIDRFFEERQAEREQGSGGAGGLGSMTGQGGGMEQGSSAERGSRGAGELELGRRGTARGGGGTSGVRLAGEVAMSVSDPRIEGVAFLDDFEDGGTVEVPLLRHAWRLGSAPLRRDRAEHVLPDLLDVASAGVLAWQHDYLGASGRTVGSLPLREIDRRIRSTGQGYESNVLHLSMSSQAPRPWRSITTVLSPSGRDLRNYRYLELYVRAGSASDALVIDVGTVNEDAFAIDAARNTGGVDARGRPWGLGVLDQEWDPVREPWTAGADERGLWNAECRASAGGVYAPGDSRANCTRGNGIADSEDLNGNGVLDTDERVFRYVVRPGDLNDPTIVADEAETGTGFRLIRILLDPAAAIGAAPEELRQVRHVRLTVVSSAVEPMVLARMRFVGSRWERRGETGVVAGLVESGPIGGGVVEVGSVGRLDGASEYLSPPSAGDAPQDLAGSVSSGRGVELTEQALRLRYRELEAGARAEVYRRYDGGPQSFLGYRELRFWALARDGGWGDGGEELVVRVGTDAENAYLYRTTMPRRGAPVSADAWRPEIVIDLERWIRLREEAERAMHASLSPTLPVVVWDDEGTHAVIIREPGRAPNLGAVRELVISVYNAGDMVASGELWVNELRLTGRERRPGLAGGVTIDLQAADAARIRLGFTRHGAHFRSLGSNASFQDENAVFLDAEVDVGRLLPRTWGIEAPLTVRVDRTGRAPLYLEGTDLRPGSGGGRDFGDRRRRVSWRLTRRDDSDRSPWLRASLDNLAVHIDAQQSESVTPYTEMQAVETSAGVAYDVRPVARSLALLPAGLSPTHLLRAAGGATEAAGPLRFRWTPVQIGFGSIWTGSHGDQLRLAGLGGGASPHGAPIESRSRRLIHHMSVGVQPFGSLSGSFLIRSGSDLLPSAQLNPAAGLSLDAERLRIGSLDLGRESERSTVSRLSWTPRLTGWLTTRASYNGTFALDAHPAYFGTSGGGTDAAAVPLRNFGNRRTLTSGWSVDPGAFGVAMGLRPDSLGPQRDRVLSGFLAAVRALELRWASTSESRFERSAVRPGLGYQFGVDPRLARDGDPSLSSDRVSWNGRSVIGLSRSLTATLEFSALDGDVHGARGERTEREREWPNLALQWSGVPRRAAGAMRNGSLGLGFSRRQHRLDDLRSAQRRTGLTSIVPVELSASWVDGLTTSYRGEWRSAEAESPTGGTGQTSLSHTASVSGEVAAPASLRPLFPAPIVASFRYADGQQRDCRLSAELPLCSARSEFSGHRERGWSLQLDTRASDMNVGLRLDRSDRIDRFGEPLRHRHLTLSLFGEFAIAAGTMP